VCFAALISWATGTGSEIRGLVHEVADAMLAPRSVLPFAHG
jgi:hypothetical protein